MNERTYSVTIEMEVTASNKQDALQFAVDDINELMGDGSLDATIVCLSKEDEVSDK